MIDLNLTPEQIAFLRDIGEKLFYLVLLYVAHRSVPLSVFKQILDATRPHVEKSVNPIDDVFQNVGEAIVGYADKLQSDAQVPEVDPAPVPD